MPPARERFPSAHDLRPEVDDRLVVRFELVSGKPDANLVEQPSMVVDVFAQAGLKDAELVAAVELGLVQGDVGVLEQGVGCRDLCAAETGADADGWLEHDAVHIERPTGASSTMADALRRRSALSLIPWSTMANSSPPRRATKSVIRTEFKSRRPVSCSSLSPTACPCASFTALKRSTSMMHTAKTSTRPRGTEMIDVRLERPAVRKTREDILMRKKPKPFFGLSLARDVLNDPDGGAAIRRRNRLARTCVPSRRFPTRSGTGRSGRMVLPTPEPLRYENRSRPERRPRRTRAPVRG